MTKAYNKLVRDRIPEIIALEGRHYAVEQMGEEEYRAALLTKLIEEAEEVRTAPSEKLLTEIADVLEVLDALMVLYNLQPEDARVLQQQRYKERGGFEKRIKLLWTD